MSKETTLRAGRRLRRGERRGGTSDRQTHAALCHHSAPPGKRRQLGRMAGSGGSGQRGAERNATPDLGALAAPSGGGAARLGARRCPPRPRRLEGEGAGRRTTDTTRTGGGAAGFRSGRGAGWRTRTADGGRGKKEEVVPSQSQSKRFFLRARIQTSFVSSRLVRMKYLGVRVCWCAARALLCTRIRKGNQLGVPVECLLIASSTS